MPLETLLALALFALVTSITPGLSNFMLLSSAATFGFARTVPLLVGITAGFISLLMAIGFGIGTILAAVPALKTALNLLGAGYLIYLAWRIGTSRSLGSGAGPEPRPIRFVEAAGFQWLNPKAWAVAATTMAVYTSPDRPFLSVCAIALVFAVVNLPSLVTWVLSGVALRSFLSDPGRLRLFNVAMVLTLVLSLVPLLT
jgi:threonine/homoserine/homoserine lactone efflux protein